VNILTSLGKRPVQSKARAAATAAADSAAAPAASGPSTDAVEIGADKPQKEWTVLVWANGKADGADRLVPSVMRELEVAGSDDNMSIVAQIGRKKRVYDKITKDWSGVRRYEVQRNENPFPLQKEIQKWFLPPYTEGIISPVKEDLGNADMGSSASISEFLQSAMKEYPAKNYAVIIYGQGAGHAAVTLDEETHQKTNYKQLAQAIREGEKASGGDVKLVAVDGSFGASLEGAQELKDVADYFVGSQAAVKLGSLQLDQIMKDLKFELAEKGTVSAEALAKWFVFETHAQPGPLADAVNPTLTAIDLKKIDAVKQAYVRLGAELAKVLADNPQQAKEALRQAIAETQNFNQDKNASDFFGDFRDIGHFAKNLQADVRLGEGVHKAAEAVLKSAADSIVDESHHGAALANSTGISAYLPLDAGYDLHNTWKAPRGFDPLHGYGDTSVAHDSQWTNVLKGISEEGAMNAKLRRWGLGNVGIVRANKALAAFKKVGGYALGLTSNAGNYNAYKFARGQEPGRYFFLPPSVNVPLSVVGGARTAFLGGKQLVDSIGNDGLKNKKQAIVDGALSTIGGIGVGTAAVGYLFKDAAFLKRPAAIVGVGSSIGKQVYGVIATRTAQAKAKEATLAMTPAQRVAAFAAQGAQDKSYYIPPVVRWLTELGSAGNADLSQNVL
jgi:hypothetical protein